MSGEVNSSLVQKLQKSSNSDPAANLIDDLLSVSQQRTGPINNTFAFIDGSPLLAFDSRSSISILGRRPRSQGNISNTRINNTSRSPRNSRVISNINNNRFGPSRRLRSNSNSTVNSVSAIRNLSRQLRSKESSPPIHIPPIDFEQFDDSLELDINQNIVILDQDQIQAFDGEQLEADMAAFNDNLDANILLKYFPLIHDSLDQGKISSHEYLSQINRLTSEVDIKVKDQPIIFNNSFTNFNRRIHEIQDAVMADNATQFMVAATILDLLHLREDYINDINNSDLTIVLRPLRDSPDEVNGFYIKHIYPNKDPLVVAPTPNDEEFIAVLSHEAIHVLDGVTAFDGKLHNLDQEEFDRVADNAKQAISDDPGPFTELSRGVDDPIEFIAEAVEAFVEIPQVLEMGLPELFNYIEDLLLLA